MSSFGQVILSRHKTTHKETNISFKRSSDIDNELCIFCGLKVIEIGKRMNMNVWCYMYIEERDEQRSYLQESFA